eukprot:1129380-Amphidinium_carterae.1
MGVFHVVFRSLVKATLVRGEGLLFWARIGNNCAPLWSSRVYLDGGDFSTAQSLCALLWKPLWRIRVLRNNDCRKGLRLPRV